MMVRVISIGALAQHPLRSEKAPLRTGHATTSLILAGNRRILVDPGLPAPALAARLGERSGLTPSDITDVFLTCFRPDARRSLALFEGAKWWISAEEREAVGVPLAHSLARAASAEPPDAELIAALEQDVALLRRCEPAPDRLHERVSLFPLPGVTPGLAGLLIEEPRHTTLICGDAVPTWEHLEQGQVLAESVDLERARESFAEAIEIADLLVLGRDNAVVNPTKRPF
ncbi:MAG: MBL fold metallo-hydrolase [Phycisphaeraceae bacterium]|nr:MAG: MBL fold metallo-hydrolase [Phycisphaeraceae bacterium]